MIDVAHYRPRPAAADDAAAIAALWTAQTRVAGSCWHGAPEASVAHVSRLMEAGCTFHLVEDPRGVPVAFAFWRGNSFRGVAAPDFECFALVVGAYAADVVRRAMPSARPRA